MDLTNEQWKLVEAILPEDPVREDGRGRPWGDRRRVLEGVLWILRTGARWQDLPPRYGPYSDRAPALPAMGAFGRDGEAAAHAGATPQGRRRTGYKECFVDGTFVPAKKGGDWSEKTKRGKGTKIMGIADGHGLPLSPCGQEALRRLK